MCSLHCSLVVTCFQMPFPADTGRNLNVHKTFRRRPGRLLNVLCTFKLRPVSMGLRQVGNKQTNLALN